MVWLRMRWAHFNTRCLKTSRRKRYASSKSTTRPFPAGRCLATDVWHRYANGASQKLHENTEYFKESIGALVKEDLLSKDYELRFLKTVAGFQVRSWCYYRSTWDMEELCIDVCRSCWRLEGNTLGMKRCLSLGTWGPWGYILVARMPRDQFQCCSICYLMIWTFLC